jgi:diguanylate cyclase (GGDEF)-like protein
MNAAATAALLAALLACATAVVIALRTRTQLRLERLAARLARERDAQIIEGVRRLGAATRRSISDVRAELDRAVREIAPAVDCVLIFEEADAELACTFATGARVAYFAGARIARSDLALLPPLAIRSGHREALGAGRRSFHPADVFALAVPLAREDGRATVLYVAAPTPVDPDAVEALVTLAEHAAFADALAGEREADRRRAEYDALTGLLTPRAFRERLAGVIERARGASLARVALLFVDTDHFKAWNDTYGHASGDALLRSLARTLRSSVTGEEFVARNGGDEFCIVFVATEKSAAVARADALRAAIGAMDVAPLRPAGSFPDVRITASIGVAVYPADASSAQELLERADAAMYHAKRTGRDGVAYVGSDGGFARAGTAAVATP